MRPRHALTPACVLALALSGCGGGTSSSADDLTWEDSPLQVALGGLFGDDMSQEQLEQEEAERSRQVEESVATCMAEQGFEYIPVDNSGSVTYYAEDDDWGTEEWTQQYGYGITTDPWEDEEDAGPEPVDEEWSDPNDDYVMAMSPAEQDAYYEALYGADAVSSDEDWVEDDGEWIDEEMPEEEYDWQDGGCSGKAFHDIYEEDEYTRMAEDPAFTELFAAVETLYEQSERDPRVTEIRAEWAECMADAGMTGMTSPDEAHLSISEEFDRLYEEADAQIDWDSIDWEALGDTDPVRELMDQAGLDALREREITTAVADLDCQESRNIESRVLEIQFEAEEEFVKTYQAEIDALVATYGQGS